MTMNKLKVDLSEDTRELSQMTPEEEAETQAMADAVAAEKAESEALAEQRRVLREKAIARTMTNDEIQDALALLL